MWCVQQNIFIFSVAKVYLKVSDETEDEEANQEYIEETNRDAVMIAAAKLVATNTIPKVR